MENRSLRDIDQIKPLIEYLEKNIKKGYKVDELKWALISQGHSRIAIDKAIAYINKEKKEEKKEVIMPKIETQEINEEYSNININQDESLWQRFKNFFS